MKNTIKNYFDIGSTTEKQILLRTKYFLANC